MGIPTVPMTDVEGRYVSAGKDYYVNEGKVTNPFASYSNTVRRNKTVNVTGSLNIGLNLYYYCCPVKLFKQNKLGLTLLTRYQPFWLSLFCENI